jgi:hypothetical protein
MSVAQIFEELPKFNREELREIAIRAMELSWDEAEREAMEGIDASAGESSQTADAMETAHAHTAR